MSNDFQISEETRKLIRKDTADFYVSQAEKKLKSVTELADRLTSRGYQLLSVLLAVLTGFGWVLSVENSFGLTVISIVGISTCTLCCLILFFKVISAYPVFYEGREPADMDIDSFIEFYHKKGMDSGQYVNIVADELEVIQQKIAFNLENLTRRQKYFSLCFDLIITGIMLCLLFLAHHAAGVHCVPLP